MQDMEDNVRVRVAPSPTGYPHLGLVYQALFNYCLAHANNGKFVLRIEDTDRTRFVEGAEEVIYNTLAWVGLSPDEGPKEGGAYGPYRQSERLALYQQYAKQLIDKGHAYRCFCTKERLDEMRKKQEEMHAAPRYDKTCFRLTSEAIEKNVTEGVPYTIRMKIPESKQIIVHDVIVGDVTFDSNQIDDQVIVKSDGYPTYHLAVVVDDYLMKITHVFRGTEWLPSYPKHVLLWEYLGWQKDMPAFAHLPILLNSDGKGKLSKRHAHTSVTYYQQEGFLPEAVVNYLANIVWNHPEGKEIFPLMDFAQALQIYPLHFAIKSNGVRFDLEKLTWMNGEYIRNKSLPILIKQLKDFYATDSAVQSFFKEDAIYQQTLIQLAQTRMKTLKEFKELVIPVIADLSEEEKKVKDALHKVFVGIQDWNKETILQAMRNILATQKAKGSILYKIITGREHGLPLPDMLAVWGKDNRNV
jgi:glutamyl-tRNA synthetase